MPSDANQAELTNDASLAAEALRTMLLAGENYRQSVANYYGIGTTDTVAISYLAIRGDLGQTELARLLGRTTSSVTTMVDRLENAGFVERAAHPEDRRRTVLKLTRRGHQATRASDQWMAVALERVSAEEIPRLSQLLDVVATGLRRSREAIPSVDHVDSADPT